MKKKSTKERILEAATQLFLEHGFDGVAVADIATLADINHSLIFHHFGNKEGLWVAVKEVLSAKVQTTKPLLPSTDMPFEDFLREFFVRGLAYYQTSPDIVRMINWQRLEVANGYDIGMTDTGQVAQLVAAFRSYQDKEIIDKGVQPEFLITMLLSIMSSAALDPNIYIKSHDRQHRYIDFCVQLICKAVCK